MLKKLFQSFRLPLRRLPHPRRTPEILSSRQHSLHRNDLSRHAVSVVERLQHAGYEAYVVGGCVRDLLLEVTPKDYDVATSATPEQVRAEFRNARVIGRRFKLVHVHFGREIIEVATFRASHPEADDDEDNHLASRNESGRILRDNIYGTLEDDAQRRDFTINALYYDPSSERILDHTHGVRDIRNRLIRLIGDPEQRYQEDPVRMLRAVRFAAKLNFDIEQHTAAPIESMAPLLHDIPAARLFDESLKLLMSGQGLATFDLLYQYDLVAPLFPDTDDAILERPDYTLQLVRQALRNTDERIAQDKPVTPAFLFAALLWPALPGRVKYLEEQGIPAIPAYQQAAHELLAEQCRHTAIPKRFSIPMREIWDMQPRLERRSGRRADQMLEHPRFRAAYDFLLLREAAGEETDGLGQWWTQYQDANPDQRRQMIRELGDGSKSSAKRACSRPRRNKPRKPQSN